MSMQLAAVYDTPAGEAILIRGPSVDFLTHVGFQCKFSFGSNHRLSNRHCVTWRSASSWLPKIFSTLSAGDNATAKEPWRFNANPSALSSFRLLRSHWKI